jgi:sterol desaturase/sphingolipid hydroxylase (fatty acid hydroxylase superfamily)
MDDLPVRYAEMGGFPLDSEEDQPIRLFKQDFLEFFTHISPVVVLILWVPVVVFFVVHSVQTLPAGASWLQIPAGILIGVLIWTLTEYVMHRFVFHFHAKSPGLQKIFFMFHGVHHYQPQCKTRLVMPPVVSIPLAVVFYGIFYLVVDRLFGAPSWVPPLFAGFILGYLVYDMIHYATHHFPMRSGYLKFLKRYHMQHHYKTPSERFGVSSPVWDKVFGTMPA